MIAGCTRPACGSLLLAVLLASFFAVLIMANVTVIKVILTRIYTFLSHCNVRCYKRTGTFTCSLFQCAFVVVGKCVPGISP